MDKFQDMLAGNTGALICTIPNRTSVTHHELRLSLSHPASQPSRDTDSFVLNLETNDLSKEIKGPLAEHLDLSNFPTNHPLYDDRNKGKLGKLKIETGAEFITEFVALKPKVYSYTTTKSRVSHNILKGVSRQKKNKLNIQDYKDCLYRHKLTRTQMNNLRFKNNFIYQKLTRKN